MSRFVRPETVRLDLTNGDWILVKKRLTTGETRAAFARQFKAAPDGGRPELDLTAIGLAKIVAYLLDWSLTDDAGVVVSIRDQPRSLVEQTVDGLDSQTFNELRAAIDAHEDREVAAMADEKKTRTSATRSLAISGSAE